MIRPTAARQMNWPAASRRPASAWLLSLFLHAILLSTVVAYVQRTSAGKAPEQDRIDRPVGVAIVYRLPDRDPSPPELAENEVQSQSAPANDSADQSDSAAPSSAVAQAAQTNSQLVSVPPTFAPPIDLDGVLAEMTLAVDPTEALGPTSGAHGGTGLWSEPGEGESPDDRRGLKAAADSSKGAVSLFGLSGTGSRFVYVVDRSDSMNGFGGRPWRAAKAELTQSLQSLTETQFFQLVFYNEQPRPYRGATAGGGPVQMLQGERAVLNHAQRYVSNAEAFGGTNHFDALRLALRMTPDIIFFLTDGHIPSLSARELTEIRRLAERTGITIHAIEFGTEPAPHPHTFVRQLAAENRGQYRYFAVSGFSDSGTWQSRAIDSELGNITPDR
jgi:hypothetical protein